MAGVELAIGNGLLGVGAGLAIGLGAVGTGVAQQQILAAVFGGIVEDPKQFGKGLFFILLPETLVIFGLVIAIMLMGRM